MNDFISKDSSTDRLKILQTDSVALPQVLGLPFALVAQWIPVT